MKALGRSLLILFSVGGGFAGISFALQTIFSQRFDAATLTILFIALAFYVFVTVAGLVYANNPARTLPLIIAFALQIPAIATPVFSYSSATGSALWMGIVIENLGWYFTYKFGCDFSIWLNRNTSSNIGINLVAFVITLVLVIQLFLRARRS